MKLKDQELFRQQCYIDGKWVDANSGESVEITNPPNGEIIGRMPNAGAKETQRAIEAADTAWKSWRAKTAKERAALIRAWHDLILENSDEEAIKMANDTEFGLAAYFFSRDIGRIWKVSEALEYGMIGINEGVISTEVDPFGGIREPELGREGAREGLGDFLETKYLCMGDI